MFSKHVLQGVLIFICLFSCFEASLLAGNSGTIRIVDFIKKHVEPLPKVKITLDVLLQARKNGKLDELEEYADQIDVEGILREVKDRYHEKLEAKRVWNKIERTRNQNLRYESQAQGLAADLSVQGSTSRSRPSDQDSPAPQLEIADDWDNNEKELRQIWEDGKLEGKVNLRLLGLRAWLHKMVDKICDALGIQ